MYNFVPFYFVLLVVFFLKARYASVLLNYELEHIIDGKWGKGVYVKPLPHRSEIGDYF